MSADPSALNGEAGQALPAKLPVAVVGVLWIAVLAVTVAPVLTAEMPPGGDFLNHLARVHILHGLGSDSDLQRFYEAHWAIIPNLGLELVTLPLLHFFDPYLAGRLFVVLSLLLMFAGVAALRYQLHGKIGLLPLGVALVAYSAPVAIGMASYYLGIGLVLLAIAAFFGTAGRPWVWRWCILSVVATVLFFVHAIIIAAYALAVGTARLETIRQTRQIDWREEVPVFGQFIVPAGFWLMVKSPTHDSTTIFGTLMSRFEALVSPVLYFNDFDVAMGAILAVMLIWLALTGRIKIVKSMRSVILVFGLVCLLMPIQLLGIGVTHVRLPIIAVLLFLAAADVRLEGRFFGMALACVLMLITLTRLEKVDQLISVCDAKRHEFLSALAHIPRGARLLPVMEPVAEIGDCHGSGYWHMSSMAVIEKAAFVPLMFMHMQPIKFTEAVGVATQKAKRPAQPQSLSAGGINAARDDWDRHITERWRQDFDYLMWMHPGTVPEGVPADVRKVASGSFFTIFRIHPDVPNTTPLKVPE